MRVRWTLLGLVVLMMLGWVLGSVSLAAADTAMTTVATGLNNPRGLAFGPDGALYVAEAGRGGSGQCAAGPTGEVCFGLSGSITRIELWRGSQERVVTGLPSLASREGMAAIGPHDINFLNRSTSYVAVGLGGDPTKRVTNFGSDGAKLAQLMRGALFRGWRSVTDLGDYEATANPDGGLIDTNPYSVLALPGKAIVADAGANALVEYDERGGRRTLAVFPNRMVDAPPFLGMPPGSQIPMQAVPTSVALGPDGHLYVGQLTGFPFPVGAANIYRVPLGGGTPTVYASGLTATVDITFGRDGSLYVVEIAKNGLLQAEQGGDFTGAVIKIAPNGTQTEVASEGLLAPGGIVVGSDGSLYVSNKAVFPGTGEVVRITP